MREVTIPNRMSHFIGKNIEIDIIHISLGKSSDGLRIEYKIDYELFEGAGKRRIAVVSPIFKEVQFLSTNISISTRVLRSIYNWVENLPEAKSD